MKINYKGTVLAALMAVALAPTFQALAAESAKKAAETKAKIDVARSEVARIRNQIGLTLEELNRLRKDSVT